MRNPIDMNLPFGKLILYPVFLLLLSTRVTAQTPLFTIDGAPVSKEDFLKAYSKNNTNEKPSEKAYKDYLELYIRYKLKVRAAYDAQLDTLPGQRTEWQSFRSQVAENYLKDEASIDRLAREAFIRGQRDIRLAHIFIALPRNPSPQDTARAYEKAMIAWNALKKGKKFSETALEYSEDPSVKENKGEIGYITVFTLPYELETLAYSISPGQYSKPYRSKGGYHIFRNEGERKALGKIKVAQILLAFPPGATAAGKEAVRHRADSIYTLLARGADFATLAKAVSGDNLSYQNGGELPEFGIGKYDSAFEAAAFSLEKDGAVSRPVLSAFGYHIIKRITRKPFPHDPDGEAATLLKQQVQNDARIEVARKVLIQKIYQQTGRQLLDFSQEDLKAFTDTSLVVPGLSSYRSLNQSTVLFTLGRQPYTMKGWLDYFRAMRSQQRPGVRPPDVRELFTQYQERMAVEYYRNHLEDYNKDFAFQLTEFKEGNLLFEIMQRKVWDKASTDSAGLRNYYEAHKDKYWWDASADALLFTCNNQKTAEDLKGSLSAGPADWRRVTEGVGAAVQADSGRYEWAQIPAPEGGTIVHTTGFTPFATNKTDNTVSFAYILNIYAGRSPRNYRDARGFVINDYQNFLEDQWIASLKKKYTIKVNETVLAGLPK